MLIINQRHTEINQSKNVKETCAVGCTPIVLSHVVVKATLRRDASENTIK